MLNMLISDHCEWAIERWKDGCVLGDHHPVDRIRVSIAKSVEGYTGRGMLGIFLGNYVVWSTRDAE